MILLRQIRLLTLRSIRARWLRFLLSAFGIVLGVAAMLAISVTNQAALDSIVRLFANTSGTCKINRHKCQSRCIRLSREKPSYRGKFAWCDSGFAHHPCQYRCC